MMMDVTMMVMIVVVSRMPTTVLDRGMTIPHFLSSQDLQTGPFGGFEVCGFTLCWTTNTSVNGVVTLTIEGRGAAGDGMAARSQIIQVCYSQLLL